MDLLYDLALRMVNIPYLWGGKNPLIGVDCSGLVSILLHAYGIDASGENSQALFNFFSKPANHMGQDPTIGSLAFYGPSEGQINHVGMCLNRLQMIEAGGGGPTILTLHDAAEAGAYVKIIKIPFGPNFRGFYLPDYGIAP